MIHSPCRLVPLVLAVAVSSSFVGTLSTLLTVVVEATSSSSSAVTPPRIRGSSSTSSSNRRANTSHQIIQDVLFSASSNDNNNNNNNNNNKNNNKNNNNSNNNNALDILPSRLTSAENLARAKLELLKTQQPQPHEQPQQKQLLLPYYWQPTEPHHKDDELAQPARRKLDGIDSHLLTRALQTVPTPAPTPAPTRIKSEMELMLASQYAVFDGIEFLSPESSYWMQALRFVEATSVGMSNAKIAQRYALAALYYATNAVATPYTAYSLGTTDSSISFTWIQKWGYETLNDVNDECTWFGITCNENGEVTAIVLPNNSLTGTVPIELILLQNSLQILDIEGNYLHNYGWNHVWWIGELRQLQVLSLGGNGFGYQNLGLPTEWAQLTQLQELSLFETFFNGPLDGSIFAGMTALTYLDLSAVSFEGSPFPETLMALPNLMYLYLGNCDFAGGLSNLIGDGTGFSALEELWLDNNPNMGGMIPAALQYMTTLKSISLSNCGLSGDIPPELGVSLSNLKRLWLFDNNLSGSIPSTFASTTLELLLVHDNALSGDMPSELCNVRSPLGLLATLGSDCASTVTCSCCTCCGTDCNE
ncbi:hypothetical protein ACA910_007508 [Epithemia clementina (nom. ined.)]